MGPRGLEPLAVVALAGVGYALGRAISTHRTWASGVALGAVGTVAAVAAVRTGAVYALAARGAAGALDGALDELVETSSDEHQTGRDVIDLHEQQPGVFG